MGMMWMVGTTESVRHDAYTDGPTPSRESLVPYMDEGDVLVGKRRDGSVAFCQRLMNNTFVPWPHPMAEPATDLELPALAI